MLGQRCLQIFSSLALTVFASNWSERTHARHSLAHTHTHLHSLSVRLPRSPLITTIATKAVNLWPSVSDWFCVRISIFNWFSLKTTEGVWEKKPPTERSFCSIWFDYDIVDALSCSSTNRRQCEEIDVFAMRSLFCMRLLFTFIFVRIQWLFSIASEHRHGTPPTTDYTPIILFPLFLRFNERFFCAICFRL